MVGNVLPEYLTITPYPFPTPVNAPAQPFPSLDETQAYLTSFAEPFKDRIRLKTELLSLEELSDGGWHATLREWGKDGVPVVMESYDAVVFATAWFSYTAWPDTPGLADLREQGLATHSATWRGPESFVEKRVAVIGNGNSANDIAAMLARNSNRLPVYRCARHPPYPNFACLPDPDRIFDVPSVREYAIKESNPARSVRVTLTDGKVIEVDHVIASTGYTFGFPVPVTYLSHVNRDKQDHNGPSNQSQAETIEPPHMPPMYRHILYTRNPTLAAIGCAMAFTPFTISDAASTWLSLLWKGDIALPERDALQAEVDERTAKIEKLKSSPGADTDSTGEKSSFLSIHVLASRELEFARDLRRDIVGTRPELGKLLPEWSNEEWIARGNMFKVKLHALAWEEDERKRKGENQGRTK